MGNRARDTVGQLVHVAAEEIRATVSRPRRVFRLFEPGRIGKYARFVSASFKSMDRWEHGGTDGDLMKRQVGSYRDYLDLQGSKLEHLNLQSHEARFRRELKKRIEDLPFLEPGARVLCLGARLGGEVRAFWDAGCFAVGIDVNPGPKNDAVLYGDFHALQFPDGTVDVVYSNSIDHAFDLEALLREVSRVLGAGGRLVLEADPGSDDESGAPPDMWQTLHWRRVDDLAEKVESLGWDIEQRRGFEYPRNGIQLVFGRAARAQHS